MNNEFTRMQQLAGIITEGYQGSDHGSSEDMVKTEAGLPGGSPKGKMTKEEAKKKIKEAILSEIDVDLSNVSSAADQAYADVDSLDETSYEGMERMDGLVNQDDIRAFLNVADKIMMELHKEGFDYDDIINYLAGLLIDPPAGSISEAKKKEDEEEIDIESDVEGDVDNLDLDLDTTDMGGDTDVDMNMDTTGDVDAGSSESKKAFSELTDAYRAAKELGDEKLIRQIANTITYFNKNIILKQG
jgi:hypothetical protein